MLRPCKLIGWSFGSLEGVYDPITRKAMSHCGAVRITLTQNAINRESVKDFPEFYYEG